MLNKLTAKLGLLLIVTASNAVAMPIVIEDNYWGAAPTRASYENRDVIGRTDLFDIQSMAVEINDGFLDVTINTNYVDGTLNTEFGDLFISTDGWNPDRSAANFANDNAATGESWEFVYDNDVGLVGDDFDILMSDDFLDANRYIFRGGQEVRRGGGGTVFNDGSSVDFSNAGFGGSIIYHISLASLGFPVGDIGLHWNMTCGNDTIEGVVNFSVPEPTTLLLLSLALVGLIAVKRRQL